MAQRDTEPSPPAAEARDPVQPMPSPSSSTASAPPPPAEPPAEPSTDELVRRLIGPLGRLLRAELRLDRERAGVRLDPRH
ncbi:hypothetical protein ACFXDJ_27890 [Streptomyces sp. NPDC059443]|uniref:hypothetical protein n=1 Tax=unclassified Streptomyces TaxID=2593676 RepID=UPI0036C3CDC9